MLTLKIKKVKFPDDPVDSGEPFGKIVHSIKVDPSKKANDILDKLIEDWTQNYPNFVQLIEAEKDLKLMLKGKTIPWDADLSSFKLQNNSVLLLMNKNPLKKPGKSTHVHAEVKASPDPVVENDDKIVPILDRVSETDIDRNALNQLLQLGYDKELSMIALRKVGTEYGSLGYDGLNKAIDFIHKRLQEEEEKLIQPDNSEEAAIKALEEEARKKEEYLQLK